MNELKKLMYKFLCEEGDGFTVEQESGILAFVNFATKELKSKVAPIVPLYANEGKSFLGCASGDAIIHKDGKYHVYVNIQDGTESCGSYDRLDVAQKEWIEAQKALNNNDFTVKDAPKPVYVEPMYQVISR